MRGRWFDRLRDGCSPAGLVATLRWRDSLVGFSSGWIWMMPSCLHAMPDLARTNVLSFHGAMLATLLLKINSTLLGVVLLHIYRRH